MPSFALHFSYIMLLFCREHKRLVKGQNRSRRLPAYEIEKIHSKLFSEWFKKRVILNIRSYSLFIYKLDIHVIVVYTIL